MEQEFAFEQLKKEILELSAEEEKTVLAKITEEINQIENDTKEEAKSEVLQVISTEMDDLKIEESKAISNSHIASTKAYIQKRDEYVSAVFMEAKNQLLVYTKSDDYKAYMIEHISKLESGTVYVKKEDVDLVKDHTSLAVLSDPDILIGGYILSNGIYDMNETLDFKLKDQKQWFEENSGLMIGGDSNE